MSKDKETAAPTGIGEYLHVYHGDPALGAEADLDRYHETGDEAALALNGKRPAVFTLTHLGWRARSRAVATYASNHVEGKLEAARYAIVRVDRGTWLDVPDALDRIATADGVPALSDAAMDELLTVDHGGLLSEIGERAMLLWRPPKK